MTPLASVAMLEKFALLKIALWRAPVLRRVSDCPRSALASVATAPLMRFVREIKKPRFQLILLERVRRAGINWR
jgi:hypothetical protein